MVKLHMEQREKDLFAMLTQAKKTGRELPKMKAEYERIIEKRKDKDINLYCL